MITIESGANICTIIVYVDTIGQEAVRIKMPGKNKPSERIREIRGALHGINGIPYKGIYRDAFWQGYHYAYGENTYGFGEESGEEDIKHIPTQATNKKKWLQAWHDGCGMGAEQ